MKSSSSRISFIGIVSVLLVIGIFYNSNTRLPISKAGDVSIAVTKLDSLPKNIFYLENSILILQKNDKILRSSDKGATWEIVLLPVSSFQELIIHPHAIDTALLIGTDGSNFITTDGGVSWNGFILPKRNVVTGVDFTSDKNKILIKGKSCVDESCYDSMYYTLDGLKTINILLDLVDSCVWKAEEGNLIYCTKWSDHSQYGNRDSVGLQLVASETFFSVKKTQDLKGAVVGLKYVNGFILAAVKPFYANGNKLYVSKNGSDFSEARFPGSGDILNGFTVLDSSSNSLSVDILSSNKSSTVPPFGTLYFSDEQGVLFTPSLEHTNHASNYLVDFETIQSYNYDGILLANTVKNYNEILLKDSFSEEDKQLVSKLSFDHGRSWNDLKAPQVDVDNKLYSCEGPCHFHLHSVTHPHNMGKVFSTTSSPGLILGVGSVGDYLRPYSQCDTFLSSDAGLTWKAIAKGPHKYETVASGSMIILVPDGSSPQDHFLYSHDFGSSWKNEELLLDNQKWIPWITILDPDSKYLQILIVAMASDDLSSGWMVQVDLSKVLSRQCDSVNLPTSNDFESWSPSTGVHNCLLGQSLTYFRRRKDSNCYIDHMFRAPDNEVSFCECSKHDYECDLGFTQTKKGDEWECVAQKEFLDQPLDCKPGSSFVGKSGFRKIPGNKCVGGLDLLKNVTRECILDPQNSPKKDAPVSTLLLFDSAVDQIFYVANSTVVLIVTKNGNVFKSLKNGGEFYPLVLPNNESVYMIVANEVISSRIYFFSKGGISVIDDISASDAAYVLKLPASPNSLEVPILDLHPTEKDWYIFTSSPSECFGTSQCYTTVYSSKDNGENWKVIDTWAEKCVWARDRKFTGDSLDLDSIYCMSFSDKNSKTSQDRLRDNLSMEDKGSELQFSMFTNQGTKKLVLVDHGVVGFYVVSNVLVIASKEDSKSRLMISSDGLNISRAEFPDGTLSSENIFTLLQAGENGVFVDVAEVPTNVGVGIYGTLFKSTQDGHYFSAILLATSRNLEGKVDFDRVYGLPGIVVANTVLNPNERNAARKIGTVISKDDGATWRTISPPYVDREGKPYSCDKCNLHLHSRVGMISSRGPFSPQGCLGLLIASGNVGTHLVDLVDSNIYISRDGGLQWTEILNGTYKWAVANYGNIIIFTEEKLTSKLLYTTDFGKSFSEFKFSGKLFKIDRLDSTLDSDSLSIFVVGTDWDDPSSPQIIHIDFSIVLKKKCEIHEDYESWSPTNGTDECMLGARRTYIQRKLGSLCYLEKTFDPFSLSDKKPCTCSRFDHECDYGFVRSFDGACSLIGKDPFEPAGCKLGEKYLASSGYRRISLSACEGGDDLTQKVYRMCGTNMKPGEVKIDATFFNASVIDLYRFNNTSSMVIKTLSGFYLSENAGSSWNSLFSGEKVLLFSIDPHLNKRAFVITDKSILYVTNDSGKTFQAVKTPCGFDLSMTPQPISTHASEQDWIFLIGVHGCTQSENECRTEGFVSWDGGQTWSAVLKNALKCVWGHQGKFISNDKTNVFCLTIPLQDDPKSASKNKSLVKVKDPRYTESSLLFASSEFAMYDRFMLAISTNSMLMVTLDGIEWAEAVFPQGLETSGSVGYTILESTAGNIFLEVLTDKFRGFGSLLKSNWNGTYFNLVMEHVNQDGSGFVDFEKVSGLNGVYLVNQITEEDLGAGSSKHLVTKMSYDEGRTWNLLRKPSRDSKGAQYECDDCSLNLNAYTERKDKRDQYSTIGSSGLLLGVGNVGKHLSPLNSSKTFLSKDAGVSWQEIADSASMYEVSGSGALLILADDSAPSESLRYSTNQGRDILDLHIGHKIGQGQLLTTNIFSDPSATSSHFIVFGRVQGGSMDGKFAVIHMDFSSFWMQPCVYSEDDVVSDYEAWEYLNGTCSLGQKSTFYRRKLDRNCIPLDETLAPKSLISPCECTRDDFECDYNFILGPENECSLKESGLKIEPLCVNGFKRYSTGYRKVSKCINGLEELYEAKIIPCSENSSSKSFIIILIVFGCGIAFFLASRYQNRLGRIRLPLDDYTSRHFSLSYYIEAFKDSMISSFYWIYDKIIFLKEEIRYRMNPTPYRYTPVSSIPRPSFEYDDFDD